MYIFHYPLSSNRFQPMELDNNYASLEPSLMAFADVWISILVTNSYNFCVARCFIYSLILIFNIMLTSGNATFGKRAKVNHENQLYEHAFMNTRSGIRFIFHRLVDKHCINAIGAYAVGGAAFGECPPLFNGTRLEKKGLLN